MTRYKRLRVALASVLALELLVMLFSTATTGCSSCASEGEYCVDEDCCEGLTCQFVEAQGYRCK